MTDNIYKVEKESDLNEILLDKQDGLVVVMFTDHLSLDKSILRQMRLNIFELTQNYPDVFFVYIDLQKFNETDAQQHTKDIKIPRFTFYYNCEDAGHVEGMDMNIFAKTLQGVVDQIRTIQEQKLNETSRESHIEQGDNNGEHANIEYNGNNDNNSAHNNSIKDSESNYNKKVSEPNLSNIGTSLVSLKNKNIQNTKNVDPSQSNSTSNLLIPSDKANETDSDLQDLLQIKKTLENNGQKVDLEQLVRVHNSMKKNQPINSPENNINSNKQQQIGKLQELQNMKYMMQMSQFKKLEQLKKLKQMKELQEIDENEKNTNAHMNK